MHMALTQFDTGKEEGGGWVEGGGGGGGCKGEQPSPLANTNNMHQQESRNPRSSGGIQSESPFKPSAKGESLFDQTGLC